MRKSRGSLSERLSTPGTIPVALFAIIPAAGLSRRMGQPKLLMKLGGRTVIERLIDTLAHPEIVETVIVFRKDDVALAEVLQRLKNPALRTVQPDVDPPDMRASVQQGLDSITSRHHPHPSDAWLLIPADHPILDSEVLDELIEAWHTTDEDILVPEHAGRSGHPTFFRWSLAARIPSIPADRGLNWLRTAPDLRVRKFPVNSNTILLDMDTPDDYRQISSQFKSPHRGKSDG